MRTRISKNRKLFLPAHWKAYFLNSFHARKNQQGSGVIDPILTLSCPECLIQISFRSSLQTNVRKQKASTGTCATLNAQTAMSSWADRDTSWGESSFRPSGNSSSIFFQRKKTLLHWLLWGQVRRGLREMQESYWHRRGSNAVQRLTLARYR